MIYSCSDLIEKLGNFYNLKKAVENGEYSRISHGLYTDKNPFLGELENLFARYPNAILTLESAFSYYELSDYVPDKYVIATNQSAHKIENPKVEQIYITDNLLDIGKITIKTNYGFINIYDKERMLIELFRLRSKLGYDYFKEIVNSYRLLIKQGDIDNHKLLLYCNKFRNGGNILRQIQEVVL